MYASREGTIQLLLLWQRRWVKSQKIHSTYSRTLEVYCIVFGFRSPNSRGKYQLNSYNLDYHVHRSRKSSNFVWISSYGVQIIHTALARWLLHKSPPHRSYIVRWQRSFLETEITGHENGTRRPRKVKKQPKKLKTFQNDSTLTILADSSKFQLPDTTVHCISTSVSLCFPTSFKIFKHCMKGPNAKD